MEAAPELRYPGGVHDVSTTCEAPKGGIRSDPRNPACQHGEGVLPYFHLLCRKLKFFEWRRYCCELCRTAVLTKLNNLKHQTSGLYTPSHSVLLWDWGGGEVNSVRKLHGPS